MWKLLRGTLLALRILRLIFGKFPGPHVMTSHSIHNVADTVMNCCYNAGQLCCAKYTEDGKWYRATVLAVESQTEGTRSKLLKIRYVDYGNIEEQPADR